MSIRANEWPALPVHFGDELLHKDPGAESDLLRPFLGHQFSQNSAVSTAILIGIWSSVFGS